MRFVQLGNGGGFDFNQTSSSFLIELDPVDGNNQYLLFDCGHGVINALQTLERNENCEIIKYITIVFVSHMHDDHIGELSSLILYRYFKYQQQTNIMTSHLLVQEQVHKYLSYSCKSELIGCKVVDACMFKNVSTNIKPCDRTSSIWFNGFTTNHAIIESSGLMIHDDKSINGSSIIITGDTKSFEPIETAIDQTINSIISSKSEPYTVFIFHDYSFLQNVARNPHACIDCMESEYSEEFISDLNLYHTGKLDTIELRLLNLKEMKEKYNWVSHLPTN